MILNNLAPRCAASSGRRRRNDARFPYLYTGEQYDPDLGFYYLRARYLDPNRGRFWTMDVWEGMGIEPKSLNKYLYAHADVINGIDPSGNLTLKQTVMVGAIVGILAKTAIVAFRSIVKGEQLSRNDIFWELVEGAGYGALGGFLAFQITPVIAGFGTQTGLYGLFGTGTATGAITASAVAQFKEFVDFYIRKKPTTFTDSAGRMVNATRGGFVAGGIFTVFRYVPKVSPSSPQRVVFASATREAQVVTPYNNVGPQYYESINNAAALGSTPRTVGLSVFERIIRASISDDEYKREFDE